MADRSDPVAPHQEAFFLNVLLLTKTTSAIISGLLWLTARSIGDAFDLILAQLGKLTYWQEIRFGIDSMFDHMSGKPVTLVSLSAYTYDKLVSGYKQAVVFSTLVKSQGLYDSVVSSVMASNYLLLLIITFCVECIGNPWLGLHMLAVSLFGLFLAERQKRAGPLIVLNHVLTMAEQLGLVGALIAPFLYNVGVLSAVAFSAASTTLCALIHVLYYTA